MLKSEKEVTDAMKAVIRELPENRPPRMQLQKFANSFINSGQISVQEAIHLLLGFPLQFKTRLAIFIPTGFKEERWRMLKSQNELNALARISEDVFRGGIIEKYESRPTE